MKLIELEELALPPDLLSLESVFEQISEFDAAQVSAILRPLSYPKFLETAYWKAVAHAVKIRDEWRCRVCNKSNNLDAHHRRYCDRGTEHLHLGDLTTLCRKCHSKFHGYILEQKNVVLTRSVLNSLRTDKGAYTVATMKALGLKSPPTKKWAHRLTGKMISSQNYELAVAGRSVFRDRFKA